MPEAVGFQVTPLHKAWKGGYVTKRANGILSEFFIGGSTE